MTTHIMLDILIQVLIMWRTEDWNRTRRCITYIKIHMTLLMELSRGISLTYSMCLWCFSSGIFLTVESWKMRKIFSKGWPPIIYFFRFLELFLWHKRCWLPMEGNLSKFTLLRVLGWINGLFASDLVCWH